MRIVVCIKQVPDTANVRLDPQTHTLVRAGIESIANPCDERALEQALRLKDQQGAEVIALSMGPSQARDVLCAALARGADSAYLVSSPAFGGADTLATGYALSKAIATVCDGCPDLVLLGRQAIDGDTAQVGPGVSEFLKLPLVTAVRSVSIDAPGASGSEFHVIAEAGQDLWTIRGRLPAVMTVSESAAAPRYASLSGTLSALKREIRILDERAIGADLERLGIRGSPTRVMKTFPPGLGRTGRRIEWTGCVAPLADVVREAMHGR